MRWQAILLLLAAFVAGHSVNAADVKIDVTANRASLYQGEPLMLTVKISGMDSPPHPDLSAITNASVKLLGSHSDSHYSITIVNGRVTKDSFSGRIFTYEIRPSQAGRFVAGPVKLNIDGRTFMQAGPVIEVVGVAKQEWAVLSISASRDAVLVDEPFDITLTLTLKRLKAPYADIDPLDPGDPPSLEVPFLDQAPIDGLETPKVLDLLQQHLVRGRDAPGFTINSYAAPQDMFDIDSFFGQRKAKFLFDKQPIEKGGQPCFEYTAKLTFVPRQEGSYTFGPAEFKGKLLVDADAEGRAIGKTIFAVGPASTVRVIPPPEEGRPSSYVGALGTNLQVDASLDTQTCNVGDPLKLTISLSGNVRMENIFPPHLGLQPELGKSFRINEDTVETITKDGRKEYLYTIRPTRVGTYEFPSVDVSYYDTRDRRYRIVKTQPIPIRANETFSVQGSNIIYTVTNQTDQDTQKPGDDNLIVAPLNVDPAGATPCPLIPRPWHVALIILGPALYAIVRLSQVVRHNIPQIAEAEKRRHAAKRAVNLLQEAGTLASSDIAGAHRMICDALRGYLEARFGVPTTGLTPVDAQNLLLERVGNKDLAGAFAAILERSFNAAFSRTEASGAGAVQDSQAAVRITQEIERALRATPKEKHS